MATTEKRSTAATPTRARRPRAKRAAAVAVPSAGYLGDITGPGITDGWGVTGTDLAHFAGLIRSLSAVVGVTRHRYAAELNRPGVSGDFLV